MRRFLFYVLILFDLTSTAQNFSVFQWNTPHFFGGQYDIRAINVDSMDIIGSDTVYYNFFSIDENNPDSNNCVNIFGPSWIGQRIIKRSDSLIIFLNYNNDSIYIHPLDGIGSSWMIYSGISATVTSITPIVINGIQDSIKIISLANGTEIIISKDHGFYKLISFRDFPTNTASYTLNDQLQLTIGNVYDFDIGDTLQFERYIIPPYGNPPLPPHNYYTKIITGKNYSANLDTVSYTYLTQDIINNLVTDSTGTHVVTTFTNGSGGDTYNSLNHPLLTKMPEEADTFQGIASRNIMSFEYCGNSHITSLNRSGDFNFDSNLGCYPAPFEPTITVSGYSIGLGFVCYNVLGCTLCGDMSIYYQLCSYHKANSSCGYIQFISSVDELASKKHTLNIFPNPIPNDGYFYIDKNDNQKALLELTDITGKIIYTKILTDKISLINSYEVASGFYFYRITYSDKSVLSGKIVK